MPEMSSETAMMSHAIGGITVPRPLINTSAALSPNTATATAPQKTSFAIQELLGLGRDTPAPHQQPGQITPHRDTSAAAAIFRSSPAAVIRAHHQFPSVVTSLHGIHPAALPLYFAKPPTAFEPSFALAMQSRLFPQHHPFSPPLDTHTGEL